jgi:periplasmic protein TonB
MASHADILDRPEPLTGPFWGSVLMHLTVIGGLSLGYVAENRFHINMGSPNGGGIGGVMVNPVASIPLPNRGGPVNPVANDTQSQVPTPPKEAPKEKAKPTPKVKAPPVNAGALPSPKAVPKKPSEAASQARDRLRKAEAAAQANTFRDQQKYNANQLYSNVGQSASSPMYSLPGGGGVRLGDSSPFGDQFGWYANLIRDNIARNWKTSDLNLRSTPPAVVVTFTIHHDGSVTNVKVGQSSGNTALDTSAERAVYDAQLPALPPQFPRSQADVELRFELGK